MGTKNRPGKFDCYENADPDEPMFVLLGRDPMAGYLVRKWAWMREVEGEPPLKVAEARACADALDAWAKKLGKELNAPDPSPTRPPPHDPNTAVFEQVSSLRSQHDSHVSHDPTCAFCCGDIT
jgi:hypothetical protein